MCTRQWENGREEFEVKIHVQVLEQCLPFLVQVLDIKRHLDHIGSKGIIHHVRIRDIREQTTTSEQTRMLIRYLMESDEQSYHKFKECLEESGQPDLKIFLEDVERKAEAKVACSGATPSTSVACSGATPSTSVACSGATPSTSVACIGPTASTGGSNSTRIPHNGPINTISSLRPSQKGWQICVRLVAKNNIRRKMKLDGRHRKMIEYFSVNFIDNTQEIRAVFFKNTVKKFYKYYRYLKLKQVYYVSGARVTDANPKYHQRAEIELKINNKTKIKRFTGEVDFPMIGEHDFIKINELKNKQLDEFVDVIGVVNYIGKVETVETAIKDRETKREVDMVDKSGMVVSVTFWGRHARIFSLRKNSVLALLGVKVKDWKGISLSRQSSTQVNIDPDVPEAHELREWYDRKGKKMTFTYVH